MRKARRGEECIVCRNEPSDFPSQPPTSLCSHTADVCLPCIRRLIQSEISSKGLINSIRCPTIDCQAAMRYYEIMLLADPQTGNRYDKLLAKQSLGGESNYVACQNTACTGGQLHEGGHDAPVVTCYVCHAKSCFTHQVPWHENFTCKQWDQQGLQKDAAMEATAQYLSKFTKECPRCGCHIEKNEGCDHMTCTRCECSFCWVCFAPYERILKDGNHHHDSTCKYHVPYHDAQTIAAVHDAQTIAAVKRPSVWRRLCYHGLCEPVGQRQ